MGVVTIGAGISFARTLGEVPMTGHAAVRAVPKITRLLSVTLRTQLHRVDELNRLAVCQSQRVVIAGIVTTDATEIAVVVFQTLVKIFQFRRVAQFEVRFGRGVAGGTIHGDRFAGKIFSTRQHARRFRLPNVRRVIRFLTRRCDDFWRRELFTPLQRLQNDGPHAGKSNSEDDSGGEIF